MKSLLALGALAAALAVGASASSAAVGGVPSFAASKRYLVPVAGGCGYCAESSAIGDLNGDGRPDVVVVNDDETISVFITKPGGGLRPRRDYLGAGGPDGAVIADLNGDGHPDVAVGDIDGFVSVFLNQGDGTLGTRHDYRAASSDTTSIAAGDLNGDGSPDLVMPNAGSVSVFYNHGDGTFAPKQDYPTGGGNPVSIALGDLNGDGKQDIVTGDGENGAVSVLLNNGDGSLQARDYDVHGAASVALGDLNGDGRLDVAAANADTGVTVLLNTGDGTLLGRRVYPVLATPDSDAGPQSIAVADLNGDHRPDLVTANSDRHVSLLLNGGGGTFHTTIDVGANKCGDVFESDRALALGDLNGDGRADITVASDTGLCVTLAKPGLCNVQEVRGLKLSQARALLARAHCRVGSVGHAHSLLYRRGQVSDERPGFGRALPAGAKVDLVVSLGR
jgi:hypothetical protein